MLFNEILTASFNTKYCCTIYEDYTAFIRWQASDHPKLSECMTYLQNLCTYVFHAGKKLLKALGKRKRLGLLESASVGK